MFSFIPTALAQEDIACYYLPNGCEANPQGLKNIVLVAGDGLVTTIGAVCVLFIIIGGMQIAFGGGDEGKITKGRETALYAVLGLIIAMLSQTIIQYFILRAEEIRDGADGNFAINAIKIVIEQLLLIFNVGVVIVVVLAGFKYLFSRGADDKAQGALRMVVWAVGGGILVNSARIIAEFVLNMVA